MSPRLSTAALEEVRGKACEQFKHLGKIPRSLPEDDFVATAENLYFFRM